MAMTAIFLAKCLPLKSSKISLEKIQYLKKRNMREMAETKKSLQRMLTKYRLHSCRLCLRPAETNIFNNAMGINFAEHIGTFFNIKVRQNDGKPQYICGDCENTLCKVVKLKQIAELAQWRLQQEAELMSESVCEDKADNHHEEIIIYHVDAPKCKQCQQVQGENNDCESCQEGKKKKKKRRRRTFVGSFVCETCGLKLKTPSSLKAHMMTHTNDFNYACGYCPFRARNSASLKIHERRHTGDRPFLCVRCNATFTSCSNLASHKRSHLPPAFKCDVCSKEFKFREPLRDHIATQHQSGKPFYCCDCGNAFATRKKLLCHERKIHNRPKMRVGACPSYIKSQAVINEESQDEA